MAPSMAALYSSPALRQPGRRPRSAPVEFGQLGVRSPADSWHSSECCSLVGCLTADAGLQLSVLLQPLECSTRCPVLL